MSTLLMVPPVLRLTATADGSLIKPSGVLMLPVVERPEPLIARFRVAAHLGFRAAIQPELDSVGVGQQIVADLRLHQQPIKLVEDFSDRATDRRRDVGFAQSPRCEQPPPALPFARLASAVAGSQNSSVVDGINRQKESGPSLCGA